MVVVSAINIFSVPFFLRHLSAEMYALWFYVITFSGLFGFSDLGLGVAVGRYIGVALGRGDQLAVREYWGTGNLIALPLLLAMGLVFAGVGVWFGPMWFKKVTPENIWLLRACLAVGGLTLFVNYYAQFWTILLQAHLDFRFASAIRIATTLLQVLPSMAIAWKTGNPLGICVWSAAVAGLQLFALVWYCRRKYAAQFDFASARIARAREMASYTAKTFATLIVGSLLSSIDRLVLGKYAPALDFDHYSVTTNVGMRLQAVGVAAMGPVFHNTSRALGKGQQQSAAAIYDEMFSFTFGWYLLVSLWVGVWHPVLLRLWLGADRAELVSPLFTPIIVAYCLTALASISGAQLGPLNRMGTALGFMIAAGTLTAAGVWLGWQHYGLLGAVYGFLFSRMACLAQDVFVIRLVKAHGWFARGVWLEVARQSLAAGLFALMYLWLPSQSFWLLVPAALHGGVVAIWLLRHQLKKFFDDFWPDEHAVSPAPSDSPSLR